MSTYTTRKGTEAARALTIERRARRADKYAAVSA